MNSLSNYNCDKKFPIHEQHADCDNYCKHPKPGKALLRCNESKFGTTAVLLSSPPFIQNFNQLIASITIDTTCLCRKNLLIDFAGILNLDFGIATFAFTLFKTCKESRIRQPVATFNFSVAQFIGVPSDRTLKFEYSSCDDQCEDCCIYTLELTSISSPFAIRTLFSIIGTLCALVIESS